MVLRGVILRGMLSLEGVLSLGVWSLGGVVLRRGEESEKQAVTPPTGMLSCYFNSFRRAQI